MVKLIMGLPKKVTILGREYLVKEKSYGSSKDDMFGDVDYIKKVIFINKSLPTNEKELAFYHETVHIAFHVTGIAQILPEKLIEVICETTANLMMDIKIR